MGSPGRQPEGMLFSSSPLSPQPGSRPAPPRAKCPRADLPRGRRGELLGRLRRPAPPGGHEGTTSSAESARRRRGRGRQRRLQDDLRAGLHALPRRRQRQQYLYVHLNNDLTAATTTGASASGGVVPAGLANGAYVDVPDSRSATSRDSGRRKRASTRTSTSRSIRGRGRGQPVQVLRAQRLLFAVQPGQPFTAAFRGTVVDTVAGTLTPKVDQARVARTARACRR